MTRLAQNSSRSLALEAGIEPAVLPRVEGLTADRSTAELLRSVGVHALLLPVTLVWRWTGTRSLAIVDVSTRDCHRQRGIGVSAMGHVARPPTACCNVNR